MVPDATSAGPPGRLRSPLPAIIVVTVGVVLAVILSLTIGARLGTLALAGTLFVAGAWRAVAPSGSPGLAVRSRGFDVGLCWCAAGAIGFQALTAPGV